MDGDNTLPPQGKELQKWEHPWKTSEIRKHSSNWTLAGDIGLLNHLQEFSQQLISRTHETEKLVDGLVHCTKRACAKVNNVINDFQMLSSIQFVENRVYDEEVEEPVATENAQEPLKSKEQREAEMLPRVRQALELGLSVLDAAFHRIQVDETSDSEDEERGPEGRIILEPKDPYENRPLPYIIGSEEFHSDDYVGLRDLCEEDTVEVSAEDGSISVSSPSSSEEESEAESERSHVLNSAQQEKKVERIPETNIAPEDSGSENSDLFELGGDENGYVSPSDSFDEEKPPKITQKTSTNLDKVVNEVKALSEQKATHNIPENNVKIQADGNDNIEKDKDLFPSAEDDSIFDDEDSPFHKKTGLFSTDVVFKTEPEEIFENDLFGTKEKRTVIPATKKSKKDPTIEKVRKESILFGGDDDDDDDGDQDLFNSYHSSTKSFSLPQPQKSAKNEDKDVLSKNSGSTSSATVLSNTGSSGTFSGLNDKTDSPSIFGDDSDSDDLFSAKSKTVSIDYGFDDDSLFNTAKKQMTELKKNKDEPSKKRLPEKVKEPQSLFDDDSIDLFSPSKASPPKKVRNKKDSPQEIPKSDDFMFSTPVKSSESLQSEKLQKVSSLESPKSKELFSSLIEEKDMFSVQTKSQKVPSPESPKSKELFSSPIEENDVFSVRTKLCEENQFQENDATGKIVLSPTRDSISVNHPTDSTDSPVSFDSAVVSSNTLNVINKDRAKIPGKRRKPTRKGRQAALQIVDSVLEESSSVVSVEPNTSQRDILASNISSSDKPSSVDQLNYSPQKKITKPQHSMGMDKNIMSQLVSEISSSKVGKNSNVKLSSDGVNDNDLFSVNKDVSNKPDSSFVSPNKESMKSSAQPSKSNSGKLDSNSGSIDTLEIDMNLDDDLFSDSAFKGFKTTMSEKQTFLSMDDEEDDDIFKAVTGGTLKSSFSISKSTEDIFDEPADIFADVQKEKYDMFPSHLYDEEDDIFGNFENIPKLTAESSTKGKTGKSETTKDVPVDIFDDPLNIMSSGD